MPKTVKTCKKCKETLPIEAFQTKAGRNKYARCPKCRRKLDRDRKENGLVFSYKTVRLHLIDALRGRCWHCDYDRYMQTLEFYHLTPGRHLPSLINRFCYTPNKSNWSLLVAELNKCALLCPTCVKAIQLGLLTTKSMTAFKGQIDAPDL